MSSTQETNNMSGKKNREKRSMLRSYIAENDPDSDLSLDGTPKPEFQDEQAESVTEPHGMKRKGTKTEQQTVTKMPGVDDKTMYEEFVEVSTKEEETRREKDTSPKTKRKSKRKSNIQGSTSDKETAKRAKGKRSKSKESSSKQQQLDHRGKPRRSFHDSQEEDN